MSRTRVVRRAAVAGTLVGTAEEILEAAVEGIKAEAMAAGRAAR